MNTKRILMELYHESDIAIEPIDDRDQLEKAIRINDDFFIPSSSKGVVKLIHKKSTGNIKVGDVVYFDPRMLVEVKELRLVVIDQKSVLMRVGA